MVAVLSDYVSSPDGLAADLGFGPTGTPAGMRLVFESELTSSYVEMKSNAEDVPEDSTSGHGRSADGPIDAMSASPALLAITVGSVLVAVASLGVAAVVVWRARVSTDDGDCSETSSSAAAAVQPADAQAGGAAPAHGMRNTVSGTEDSQ